MIAMRRQLTPPWLLLYRSTDLLCPHWFDFEMSSRWWFHQHSTLCRSHALWYVKHVVSGYSFLARTTRAMTLLPTLCLTHFFHTSWIGCASMGKMMCIFMVMDLWYVSASTWRNAWWNDVFANDSSWSRWSTPLDWPWLLLYSSTDESWPCWFDVEWSSSHDFIDIVHFVAAMARYGSSHVASGRFVMNALVYTAHSTLIASLFVNRWTLSMLDWCGMQQ